MRTVIADDSALIREGLRLILEDAGHKVVAGVGDGPSMIEAALDARPDLVISDIRMPPSHTDEGLTASIELRRSWPEAPILLLSQYVIVDYAEDLVASGAGSMGYLLKDRVSDIDAFLATADRVADGGTVLDPEVVRQLLVRDRAPWEVLTPRETEVLELMAAGHTNAGIADQLVISLGGVEKHTQRIFAKLELAADDNVHRRVTAVLRYLNGRVPRSPGLGPW
ncbi:MULTISPECIES: response regulator [Kocuria]|uniref:response regulator n=1 Tax=Kocuria TaxID=57493 RepID=UPI00065F7584|nr:MULTISPECIES: response regulator transcription factor [Kocuria]RUQ22373.1 DNA-binding response regulator [Kocuria sp. HSID16901]